MGLQGIVRGKAVRTTISDPAAACPLDCVNRPFKAPRPNALWVNDFTSVATWAGFVSPRPASSRAWAALILSLSKNGDSDDNARVETIDGLFKAQVIHRGGPWRSFEAVEFATLEWVDWFNTRRLLEPIGNLPPVETEARDFA